MEVRQKASEGWPSATEMELRDDFQNTLGQLQAITSDFAPTSPLAFSIFAFSANPKVWLAHTYIDQIDPANEDV